MATKSGLNFDKNKFNFKHDVTEIEWNVDRSNHELFACYKYNCVLLSSSIRMFS